MKVSDHEKRDRQLSTSGINAKGRATVRKYFPETFTTPWLNYFPEGVSFQFAASIGLVDDGSEGLFIWSTAASAKNDYLWFVINDTTIYDLDWHTGERAILYSDTVLDESMLVMADATVRRLEDRLRQELDQAG